MATFTVRKPFRKKLPAGGIIKCYVIWYFQATEMKSVWHGSLSILKSCYLLALQTHIHTHSAELQSSFHKMVMRVAATAAPSAVNDLVKKSTEQFSCFLQQWNERYVRIRNGRSDRRTTFLFFDQRNTGRPCGSIEAFFIFQFSFLDSFILPWILGKNTFLKLHTICRPSSVGWLKHLLLPVV